MTGEVTDLLTGTAANGYTFNFENAVNTSGVTKLSVPAPAAKVAGPSISNVIIGGTDFVNDPANPNPSYGGIHLGAGGSGAAGGSVVGLTILDDVNGLTVQAGAGGSGGVVKTYGGGGGSITGVVMNGPLTTAPDTSPNSPISFIGGAGGNGIATAKGGAGGSVSNVYIDYGSASLSSASNTTVLDNVTSREAPVATAAKRVRAAA